MPATNINQSQEILWAEVCCHGAADQITVASQQRHGYSNNRQIIFSIAHAYYQQRNMKCQRHWSFVRRIHRIPMECGKSSRVMTS